MGPYAGVDYITSPYVHSNVYSTTFTMGNPMPEATLTPMPVSTLSPSQELWIWPQKYCRGNYTDKKDKSNFPNI
jgi:hypothetical protein